jgi:hypothetical protein
MAALNYSLKKTFFLSFIPSIVVFATGLFFGGLTPAILLMLPFIWTGNFVLMLAINKIFIEKNGNYFVSTITGALAKTTILFASASILFSLSVIPAAFVSAFGITQLITAGSGAMAVFVLKKTKK